MTERRPRLLLADDDAVGRAMVGAALEDAGFEVVEADDGQAAIEAFDADPPDLLILDVLMPRLGGFEACAAIRKHPRGQRTPILILTSREDSETISAAYEAGATDFLPKSLGHRLLAERTRFLLRSDAWRSEVAAQRRRLGLVQDLARVGHWELDRAGRSLHVAEITASILGIPAPELTSVGQLLDALADDSREVLSESLAGWREMAKPFRLDARLRNGFCLSIHGAGGAADEQDDSRALMLAIQDTTALHEARDRADRLMLEDSLTGLPNRARILDLLGGFLQGRAPASRLAVIALRIVGHERGGSGPGRPSAEDLLRAAAERIHSVAATAKWRIALGHLGNGAFVAVLDSLPSPGVAVTAASQLLDALKRPIEGHEWQVALGGHAGIALWPRDALDAGDMIAAAQSAAETARAANARYRYFSPDIHVAAQRRLDIESALRRAIRDRLLWVAYQPRIDLADGRILGAEALLRLDHPKLGSVVPAEFIPIAEDAGLIVELGDWVLRSACNQAAAWRQQHRRHVAVSVNVSAEQLRLADKFTASVRAALESARLSPSALELELTESMIIDANPEMLASLQSLRTLGVQIALDDFGTGYSALGLLSKLPVDCLKIDRSFVATLDSEATARGITQAVLAMAKSLQIRTVGEGIETPAQLKMLREGGCNEGQGFLISKPVPAAEVDRLLALPALPVGDDSQLLAG